MGQAWGRRRKIGLDICAEKLRSRTKGRKFPQALKQSSCSSICWVIGQTQRKRLGHRCCCRISLEVLLSGLEFTISELHEKLNRLFLEWIDPCVQANYCLNNLPPADTNWAQTRQGAGPKQQSESVAGTEIRLSNQWPFLWLPWPRSKPHQSSSQFSGAMRWAGVTQSPTPAPPELPRWAVVRRSAVIRRTCALQDNISSLLLPWAGHPLAAWL